MKIVFYLLFNKNVSSDRHTQKLWLTSGENHGFPLVNKELVIYMKYEVGLTIKRIY